MKMGRALLIAVVAILEAGFLYFFFGELSSLLREFDNRTFSWIGPTLTMLVASPIAFFVWFFRDSDKRKDQEHTEENIRQQDFHQLEEWATAEDTNEALQIASIHQLLPYLKCENGDRFVRPSFEIYRSLLSSWEVIDAETLEKTIYRNPSPKYIQALHTIFKQELEFFRSFHNHPICTKYNWIPLRKIDLKCMSFNDFGGNFTNINLSEANLSYLKGDCLDFENACLSDADFALANVTSTNFRSCKLHSTNFRDANLTNSDFKNARFNSTIFIHTNLKSCKFNNSQIGKALFRDVNLTNANFEGTSLKHAIFSKDFDPSEEGYFFIDFIDVNLENADFSGSNLDGSIFCGSTNFENAKYDHKVPNAF